MQPDILLAIDKAHKGDNTYRSYLGGEKCRAGQKAL